MQAVDGLLRRILPAHIADSLHELRVPLVSPGMPAHVTAALATCTASASRASMPDLGPAAPAAQPTATLANNAEKALSTEPEMPSGPSQNTCLSVKAPTASSSGCAAARQPTSCRGTHLEESFVSCTAGRCFAAEQEDGLSLCKVKSARKEQACPAAGAFVGLAVPIIFMDVAVLLLTVRALLVPLSR